MKNLILNFILFITLLSLILTAFYFFGKKIWYPYYEKCYIYKDVQPLPLPTPVKECKEKAPVIIEKNCPECIECPIPTKLTSEQKLKYHLADANFIVYPKKLTLIGLKHEQLLEVWGEHHGKQVYITTYPFTAFSGRLGPKFREGDRQIPEGIYKVGYLNPNSKFHLSININYPNAFDKKMAKKEKRSNLGSAIMIHGNDVTVGCIPIGDDNIEELYHLVEKVGIQNTKIILAPIDFRYREVKIGKSKHPWVKELYKEITKEMKAYQKDNKS
jgi:murein L,D-transpeptidase YafK